MGRQAVIVLYVLAMVAVVVGADILFLRHNFWARLIVNVGIVLVFAAFYLRFLKRPRAQPPQDG
jgi:membrane protein implicated in regulation of membrane protease activity